MILSHKDNLIDVHGFLKNLGNVVQGVLRVSVDSPSPQYCTGWLLTNKLVVIPDYVGTPNDRFLCYPNSLSGASTKPIKAKLVFRQVEKEEGDTPALLELEDMLDSPTQVFQAENCDPGDTIIIVGHPLSNADPRFSFGRITELDDTWLFYDADTMPGSTGSPVINIGTGKMLAMHNKSGGLKKINIGLSISKILESLKTSPYWDEISKYHKIADTSVVQFRDYTNRLTRVWKDIHLKAALSWSLNKSNLSKEEQKELEPFVVDTLSSQFVLKPSDRLAILESKSIAELRKIKVEGTGKQQSSKSITGQKVINRILQGGPYNMAEVEETELPYWIQAVRWFAPLDNTLPTAAEVNKVLERKRIRSRLSVLGGNDFKGRDKETDTLKTWYQKNNGPIMVTGIGGIGKSALISHFALGLSEKTPLLWLDFDSPQIAPDDALSMLRALSEQITTQVENFSAPPVTNDWEQMAIQFGENFSKALSGLPPPLLILDGFEVAQHAKHYQEIWKLLELVLTKCADMRIIVSGRSKVTTLSLGGKPAADPVALEGMEVKDATAFLAQYKIRKKDVVDKVIAISKGIPLVLKLAVHFIGQGGKMEELPDKLPRELVEGYLYQRILDRVMETSLKPISSKALVLRKVTLDIIKKILPEYIPKELTAEETFEGLSRELGLITENESVSGVSVTVSAQSGVLQLRPELRTATIKLLEIENLASVKEIDQKAANFYKKQDLSNFDNRAELIYHLLRIDNLKEADQYWQTECAPLLKYTEEDLAESAQNARSWLKGKIGQVITETIDNIKIWEIESVKQILNMLSRGHFRGIYEVLKQRTERSENSPLLIYDAWAAWNQGDVIAAMQILENSKANNTTILRDQKILQALLQLQHNDPIKADTILSTIEPSTWNDRKDGAIEALALRAARLRLTVHLDLELEIARATQGPSLGKDLSLQFLKSKLFARDVMLPYLAENLSEKWLLESVGSGFEMPVREADLVDFAERLREAGYAKSFLREFDFTAKNLADLYAKNTGFIEDEMNAAGKSEYAQKIMHLLLQGEYRWKEAKSTLLLADLAQTALNKEDGIEPLRLSIIASLAAFRGLEMGVFINGYSEPTIDSFLMRVITNNLESVAPPLSERRKKLFNQYIKHKLELNNSDDTSFIKKMANIFRSEFNSELLSKDRSLKFILQFKDDKTVSLILYLFGPDPLEMLCKRVIGLSDNYKF